MDHLEISIELISIIINPGLIGQKLLPKMVIFQGIGANTNWSEPKIEYIWLVDYMLMCTHQMIYSSTIQKLKNGNNWTLKDLTPYLNLIHLDVFWLKKKENRLFILLEAIMTKKLKCPMQFLSLSLPKIQLLFYSLICLMVIDNLI